MNDSLPPLIMFHTAQGNVDMFSGLMASAGPEIPVQHILRDDLLKEAFRAGELTDGIRRETCDELIRAAREKAGLVVCTCSTLGPGADDANTLATGEGLGPVHRIDRPMADAGVRSADHIAVAATFETTLGPTMDLVRDAAERAGQETRIDPCLISGAREQFEAGDMDSYFSNIANGLKEVAGQVELIILAQASMAPALELLDAPLPVPVLSSPQSGTEAAVAEWRKLYG